MVTFVACPFMADYPEQREGQRPSCRISIDNVGRELVPQIRAALGVRAYIDVLYREYLGTDLIEPEHALRGLTWPALKSGPTCGIGYDLGQATKAQIKADWEDKVSDAELTAMLSCAGVTGTRARDLALELRGAVNIHWDVALEVYANHDLPRYTAMCRVHLPGYDALSPHCRGALFSLVMNRGASFDLPGPRYAEMRDIKAAIKRSDLARVPALLRSMKRIWKDDPAAKGLLARREREAQRWEQGLAEHHPEENARLDQVAPVPDPELVFRVQQQLKSLGYYQVGSADGSLTPQGRTEGAILAFRYHEGLPLTTAIDDEFLTRLAKAQPPEIAEHRANASVEDLRPQGSATIAFLTARITRFWSPLKVAMAGTPVLRRNCIGWNGQENGR